MKPTRFFPGLFLNIFLLAFIAGSQPANSQTGAYSANFQSLLNQMQMLYCQPNGYDFNQIRSNYPITFATILGHGLRQQLLQTQRYPELRPAYDKLQQEARNYFSNSFRQYQYRFDNGQPMMEEALWEVVQNGINGLSDDMVLRDFRVAQGTMPMVLAGNPNPGIDPGVQYEVPINKPKEKNAIILLGEEAPPVRDPAPSSFETTTPMPTNTDNSFELNK
jgi:hypothetical protein